MTIQFCVCGRVAFGMVRNWVVNWLEWHWGLLIRWLFSGSGGMLTVGFRGLMLARVAFRGWISGHQNLNRSGSSFRISTILFGTSQTFDGFRMICLEVHS